MPQRRNQHTWQHSSSCKIKHVAHQSTYTLSTWVDHEWVWYDLCECYHTYQWAVAGSADSDVSCWAVSHPPSNWSRYKYDYICMHNYTNLFWLLRNQWRSKNSTQFIQIYRHNNITYYVHIHTIYMHAYCIAYFFGCLSCSLVTTALAAWANVIDSYVWCFLYMWTDGYKTIPIHTYVSPCLYVVCMYVHTCYTYICIFIFRCTLIYMHGCTHNMHTYIP